LNPLSVDDNEIIIRRAIAADVETLFDIRTSVIENRMTREELAAIRVTPETVSALLSGGQAAAFLAAKDDRALGFSMARADVADVFALFVRPEAQGAGLGSRLLAESERWLAERGVGSAWLLTGGESQAVTFYERRGWCGEDRTADGQIRFVKRLDNQAPAAVD
jgi:GNAT superfamily N-acetyltransferase